MTAPRKSPRSPSDKELDDIKQLLGARTIHLQLGCDPDSIAAAQIDFICRIEDRMHEIFGHEAVKKASISALTSTAAEQESQARAFHSMYDTALMRIWWEKFGDTYDVRGGPGASAAGGGLGADDPANAKKTT